MSATRPPRDARTPPATSASAGQGVRAATVQPTGEQQAAADAFLSGGALVLEAGAGTGKTSTLKLLAGATPRRRGIYIAFNKAVADEAKASFPENVVCATAHSLAFRALGYRYRDRLRGPRMPGGQVARVLRINEPFRLDAETLLQPAQLARLAMGTVAQFCYSADHAITSWHLPFQPGLEERAIRKELAKVVIPLAERAWADLSRTDGRLKFGHDHYLKLWQLTRPVLDADFVLLDEAQDTNPVVGAVVDAQPAQRVLVGDANQAIYGWRGAVDAMSTFAADHRLQLTQSFRFGPAIAEEANRWLGLLGATLRLSGSPSIVSTIAPIGQPHAVLCRTNAEAVASLLAYHEQDVPVALVGGGNDIRQLAKAAVTLEDGRGTEHPELCMFSTWGQVQDYVDNDHDGADLAVFVRLIDTYGPDAVIEAVDRAVDEKHARVTVSTAHKAKGREWDTVHIADDFGNARPKKDKPGDEEKPLARAELMLAYVAVTRARRVLDRSGLAWIDELAPVRPGLPGVQKGAA